jgi:methylthioribose-1-phosphate isomerase
MSEPNPASGSGPPVSPEGGAGVVADPGQASVDASGADMGRRRFFRSFAQELVQTAATVVGAATALQRSSLEAAGAILNPAATVLPPVIEAPALASAPVRASSAPTGFRTSFRMDGDRLVLVDQRRLPTELVEVECRTAVEVANEIRDLTIRGGPAIAQAAGLSLAMTAARIRASQPYARRAILRAGQRTLLSARPTSRSLESAVARVMARYEAVGEFTEDGDLVAQVVREEAETIIFEATDDHGRIADAGLALLPVVTERPLAILTHGNTGTLAGGQFGTAMAVVQAAVQAEREVLVYVGESRPTLDGARVTAWELSQAGIEHILVADTAVGWLLEAGRVDAILVGAERIAANGDVANDIGTYQLAVLAARHGVPFYVCAPLAAVDLDSADGRAMPIEQRGAVEVTRIRDRLIAPVDTPVLNPSDDVTPHDLIGAIVTEEGVLRAPYGASLLAALAARARRLPGFGAPSAVPAASGSAVPAASGSAAPAADAPAASPPAATATGGEVAS